MPYTSILRELTWAAKMTNLMQSSTATEQQLILVWVSSCAQFMLKIVTTSGDLCGHLQNDKLKASRSKIPHRSDANVFGAWWNEIYLFLMFILILPCQFYHFWPSKLKESCMLMRKMFYPTYRHSLNIYFLFFHVFLMHYQSILQLLR